MKTSEVKAFFAELASSWDENNEKDSALIGEILDNAGVSAGKDVLDVACGTGILIPDYLDRGAASVTAIDITPEMTEIARKKFTRDDVTVICGDAAETEFQKKFDCIVIYNALPHFQDPERLISHLTGFLNENGILTVAHGASRQHINNHHRNVMNVSKPLMPAEELAEIFSKYMTLTAVISDERMYQIAGMKGDHTEITVKKIINEEVDEMHDHMDHEHTHGHTHEHGHEHTHEHTHEHITAFDSTEQAVRILSYMLDHNRSHAEELHEICHRLEATGKEKAAEFLDKAVDAFREGNELMDQALQLLNSEEE